jgi:DNA-binding CsgD family transcriptional regulator
MNCIAQSSSLIHSDHKILTVLEWGQIQRSLSLSVRELQITQHIFDDNKTEYIAQELGISVHTVNTHLQRLYSKLEVRSRAQLVLRVLKAHLEYLLSPLKSDISREMTPLAVSRPLGPGVVGGSDTRIRDLYSK